jgi:uncharacterized membrane protein YphA (DoxX/SURF4 family)
MASRGGAIGAWAAPLVLRLALGATLAWSGLAKVFGTVTVGPETAARLASLGASVPRSPAAPGAPISNVPGAAPPVVSGTPSMPVPAGSAPQDPMPADRFRAPGPGAGAPAGGAGSGGQGAPSPLDFAAQTAVPARLAVAVAIDRAANPAPRADGSVPARTWPAALGSGAWPLRLSSAVTGVELIGGAMVLMGLVCRVWSAALAGVVAGSIWLTQMGPAIQDGTAVLGVFPSHAPWAMEAWAPLLWRLALLAMALALALGGPGRVAIDHTLFGESGEAGAGGDHDD